MIPKQCQTIDSVALAPALREVIFNIINYVHKSYHFKPTQTFLLILTYIISEYYTIILSNDVHRLRLRLRLSLSSMLTLKLEARL